MMIPKRLVRGLVACSLLLSGAIAARGEAAPPADAAALETAMRAVLAHLDGAGYAAAVSWDEHLVLSYRLAQGRDPSALEFAHLTSLAEHTGMPRSAVLSVALRRSGELGPDWDTVRAFLARAAPADFRADAELRAAAARIAATPPAEVVRQLREQAARAAIPWAPPAALAAGTGPSSPPGGAYQVYYGYLHAHSMLSDGEGSADQAYRDARNLGGLDFFGLTDHGELLRLWPWQNKWRKLKDAARRHYQPGVYVTLWGFEWSSPVLGHINVINSPDYTDAVTSLDLDSLYSWLAGRPAAFGRFNHPGAYDLFGTEFDHLRLVSAVVPQMVGIETWNGGGGLGEYFYQCAWAGCGAPTYLDEGNRRGWRLGAVGGQDNHSPDWGWANDLRVGVLATELTREAILDAHRNRRFFASEDKDLSLDFRAGGFPMGSVVTGVPRDFTISACDGSGDSFVEARLYRDGAPIAVQPVSGTCFDVLLSDPGASGAASYYTVVRQADDHDGDGRGDEAVASPIWFTE